MRTDLAVLGGGPAGYAAAFRAADLGVQTTVIEQRDHLGGVCLLEGCIPSKALLHIARSIALAEESAEWGVTFDGPRIDLDALRKRKEKCIADLTGGLKQLASRRKVRVVKARGILDGPRSLRLEGEGLDDNRVEFEHLIICAGSTPIVPGPLRIESDRLMTSQQALALSDVPGTLLVVGGGYIGLELGTVYARLGSRVTVVEMLDRLLPGIEPELVKPLAARLDGLTEAIHLGTKVESLREVDGKLEAALRSGDEKSTARYDRVLVAVGRRPVTETLGLDAAKVETDKHGFIAVDAQQRTSVERIFAAGDATGGMMLAHKAFHEGYVAAEVVAGEPSAFDRRAIPAVVFTDPEIASCGLTEAEAKARSIAVDVARYPWAASGRAHALGRPEGLTKLLFERETQRLLGAGIVGVEAGDLIGECTVAVEMGCTAVDLAGTIHPHPTTSETVSGAAEVLLGLATEIYRPKKR